MKKTQVIELFHEIKQSWVTFVSVTMFVLLGVAIFLGLSWTTKAISNQITQDYVAENTATLDFYFPYALDDLELSKLSLVKGVDSVEGSYEAYVNTKVNGTSLSSKFISLTKEVNKVTLVSGKTPAKENEVNVEEACAKKYGLKVGDTVSVTKDDATSSALILQLKNNNIDQDALNKDYHALKHDSYIITGIVSSSSIITIDSYGTNYEDGSYIRGIFYCNRDAFDTSSVSGYNHVLIVNKGLQNCDYNSSIYSTKLAAFIKTVQPTINSLSTHTYKTIKTSYKEIIRVTQEKLDLAKGKIDAGETTLNNKKKELEAAKKKLEQEKKELKAAKNKVASVKKQLKTAKEKLAQAQKVLDEVQPQIDTLNSALAEYGLTINDLTAYENLPDFDALLQKYNIDVDQFNSVESTYKEYSSYYASIKDMLSELEAYNEDFKDYEGLLTSNSDYQSAITAYQSYENNYLQQKKNYDTFKTILEKYNQYKELISKYKSISEVLDLYKQYLNLLSSIKEGASQIAQAQKAVVIAEAKIKKAEAQIKEAEKKIEQAELEIQKGEDKLNQAIEEYSSSNAQFNLLKDKGSQIKDYDTVSSTILTNSGYIVIQNVLLQANHLKLGLGGLFFLIAVMICYNVLSRLIKDRKKAIGTKKALGFVRKEITLFYLSYTGLMVITGILLGTVLAVVIEQLLSKTMVSMFYITIRHIYFSISELLIISLVEVILFVAVTLMACMSTLRKSPIRLLNDNTITQGKSHFYNRFSLYKRLPLLSKTIINNCFEDHKRVFSTIVGITSCVVLLITSLTLRNNVLNSFNAQFTDLYHFDSVIEFNSADTYSKKHIQNVLEKEEITCTPAYYVQGYIENETTSCFVSIWVYEDKESLSQMVTFKTDGKTPANTAGIYIPDSLKLSKSATLKDTFTLQTLSNETASTKITNFYLSYNVTNDIFMDKETYEKLFNAEYRANRILISTQGVNKKALKAKLKKYSGFEKISNYKVEQDQAAEIFSTLASAVVVVYFVVSILLGIFILTNLLSMLVEEKKREMIVLMINGYSLKQAKRYVALDTRFLSVISIILGVILGNITGNIAVMLMESKYIRFIHGINLQANIISIVVIIILIMVISHIVFNEVNHFSLTDINKD